MEGLEVARGFHPRGDGLKKAALRSLLIPPAVLLCVVAAACGRPTPARHVAPLPQVSGTLALDGLTKPVRVVRDRSSVPHIYAQSDDDLFFAQGFVQAQDRLFQMDLWRRSSQGRLSEVLGPNFAARDAMTRRMQFRGDLASEWASYGADVKPIVEAFVRGVNAWVSIAQRDLPEEFVLAGWVPELWKPEDLLNRTDAFLQSGDADLEAFRARLIAAVGAPRANEILPAEKQYSIRGIPPDVDLDGLGEVVSGAIRSVGTAPFFLGLAAPVAPAVAAGSNAWAVPGSRSTTGAPLVASDPHRALAHPSLRYLIHLSAPGWNVAGAVSPWLPGVAVGHNDRIAWGLAAFPADTQDAFIERVNPANPHQVESRGRFVDTLVVKDPIVIRGRAKPFDFEREYTPHGVVIASDRQRHLAFTLKWSGMEEGAAGELASLAVDRAQSAADLLVALKTWRMPVVEVVYADADGKVGRQVAGFVPNRTSWDGAVPAPGWTGAFEWRGWRRLDELPHTDGEEAAHRVAIAANRNVARTNRLLEVFGGEQRFGVDDLKAVQHDTMAWNAEQIVPLLVPLHADRNDVETARRSLLAWDRRIGADSSTATLYVYWEEALLRGLAERRVPQPLLDAYLARARLDVTTLTMPSRVWFDRDPEKARDALLLDALAVTVDRVRAMAGAQPEPTWGRLHAVTFKHPLALTEAARRLFDVGPFDRPGYAETVMATYTRSSVSIGASFSEIVDVSNWDRSAVINAPGQSGSPRSAHFSDLARPWAAGEYFPLAFSDAAVQANAESTLVLTPAPNH
jgi:penicillin amidase